MVTRTGTASDVVPLGPKTVNRYTTTIMVEAVVVGVVGTTVAVGHLPDLPGETTDTDQEAGGIKGFKVYI